MQSHAQIPLVIAHEKAHIHHHDHWLKPIVFLLLSVYWFNPLIWIAYILFCQDIELTCDERVINELGMEAKKSYSYALLDCSVKHTSIAMCPLAFGEVGVKQRVKNILRYKKPAFWTIIGALLAILVISVVFLTNPTSNLTDPTPGAIYRLQDDDSSVPASILLFEDDKFQFTTSPLSSYLNIGTYRILLITKIQDNNFAFRVDF